MLPRKIKQTCDYCPVQFEGTIGDYPFYFRARFRHWRLTVARPGKNAVWPGHPDNCPGDVVFNVDKPWGRGEFDAGYMPHNVARCLLRFALAAAESSVLLDMAGQTRTDIS